MRSLKKFIKQYLQKHHQLYSVNPDTLLGRPKDTLASLKRSGNDYRLGSSILAPPVGSGADHAFLSSPMQVA